MAKTKKFKAETKKLLDLMINSIYTNKEIFLRELISNASDAIDKHYYLSLKGEVIKRDYEILIEVDKDNKLLKITDNGIGMTEEELENNLGTIARSGSKEFLNNIEDKKDIDIIGQFGVGFYSAFMVADKVTVLTKSEKDNKGYSFESDGLENYKINEIDKDTYGTTIILKLREDTEDFKYSKFLEEYTLQSLIKKYSDYIRYPIKMNITKYEPKEDNKEEYETKVVLETINSMIPIWKKNKKDLTEEEINNFYMQKFQDYQEPFTYMNFKVEGNVSYNSLIFIPKNIPQNLYSDKYEKGLQLYTKGVFIMDKCKKLVPDYLRFIKGLVDTDDLPLNISRETLQDNKQLDKIATNIEKKVLSELEKMLKNDRDKYVDFFDIFGVNLKFGIYDNFGEKKDLLKDLVMYKSLNEDKLITLKEYVDNLKEGQNDIYYAFGKTKDQVLSLPQLDLIKNKGYDILILTDDVDEFAIKILDEYDKHKFKSVNQGDLDILSDEEKKKIDDLKENKKDLLAKLKEILKDKVSDVVLSKRLTDSPVCLVSGDGVSLEMEKVLSQMPNNQNIKASKILEINPNHELFTVFDKISNDNLKLEKYAKLLYDQALLIEGFKIDNPVEFSNLMVELMIDSNK